ncbi:hypothetical protein NQ318_015936 [Aromia moschata]|uniref:Uncharacterized protein n=1 Tax=Aromia moschata TaxID=1265417 RepID=A0AAV8XI97_9CUCU|nr:hypothetical protein NQ318_015936 [Aromia moschata]
MSLARNCFRNPKNYIGVPGSYSGDVKNIEKKASGHLHVRRWVEIIDSGTIKLANVNKHGESDENMSLKQENQSQTVAAPSPTCMESVNRITKLPVVESTINTATNLYEKVKDYNSVTHWTLQTAENTVNKAAELGKPIATPVIRNLERPIKKVDDVLCSGLDYVERKVPAVKLPPTELIQQIYNSTKDFVNTKVTPAVESAYSYVEPAVDPAVQGAKHVIEPAAEKVMSVMEPIVHPVVESATALKDNIMHRVDEYLHGHKHEGDVTECQDCQDAGKKYGKST